MILTNFLTDVFFCLVRLLVPIIPSYLYSLDSAVLKNNSPHEQVPQDKVHSIVSLYDNSVRSFTSNITARSTAAAKTAELQPNSSDCPQSSSLLMKENVKVGMLFASKATVQLITNPFVGPLTNRYVLHRVVIESLHCCHLSKVDKVIRTKGPFCSNRLSGVLLSGLLSVLDFLSLGRARYANHMTNIFSLCVGRNSCPGDIFDRNKDSLHAPHF